MNKLPTKDENPQGLHQKYIVTRTDGKSTEGQVFFCLRLDAEGMHGAACRRAARAYAHFMKAEIPQLAHDLVKLCDDIAFETMPYGEKESSR